MKKRAWLMGFVLAGLAVAAAPVHAGPELVDNGGFETGDFTGWDQQGQTDFNGVTTGGLGPNGGNFVAFFGPVGTDGGINQVINVGAAGQRWHLNFDWQNDNGVPGNFSVFFGGDQVLSLVNPSLSGLTHFHLGGITNGASMLLQFNFRDDPGFMFLDNVSLVIPEPATIALLGAALAGLGFSRRRKIA